MKTPRGWASPLAQELERRRSLRPELSVRRLARLASNYLPMSAQGRVTYAQVRRLLEGPPAPNLAVIYAVSGALGLPFSEALRLLDLKQTGEEPELNGMCAQAAPAAKGEEP